MLKWVSDGGAALSSLLHARSQACSSAGPASRRGKPYFIPIGITRLLYGHAHRSKPCPQIPSPVLAPHLELSTGSLLGFSRLQMPRVRYLPAMDHAVLQEKLGLIS